MNLWENSVTKKKVTKLDDDIRWDRQFENLVKFKQEHGHCIVPQSVKTLGPWVSIQRMKKNNNKLTEDRVKRLNDLGFVWVIMTEWEENYEELVNYKKQHGDCKVSQLTKLGRWVHFQRIKYKRNMLEQHKIDKLNALGFVWPIVPFTEKWDTHYEMLLQYKKEHGDTNVSTIDKKLGHDLGKWVARQRANRELNKLSKERIEKLDSIGFIWNTKDAQWEEGYKLLCEYKNKNGDCNVPVVGKPLGRWVARQRRMFSENDIKQERVDKLNKIGFIWSLVDKNWEDNYQLLVNYKKENGNCEVPTQKSNLGSWVTTQRHNYKLGELSQDRIKRLEAIGFKWSLIKGSKHKVLDK